MTNPFLRLFPPRQPGLGKSRRLFSGSVSDSAILHSPSTCPRDGKSAKKVIREPGLEPADLKGGKFLTMTKVFD
jgi:hypothetical protein